MDCKKEKVQSRYYFEFVHMTQDSVPYTIWLSGNGSIVPEKGRSVKREGVDRKLLILAVYTRISQSFRLHQRHGKESKITSWKHALEY